MVSVGEIRRVFLSYRNHPITERNPTILCTDTYVPLPYLISIVSLFKDCGSGPCSLLFSRFLQNRTHCYNLYEKEKKQKVKLELYMKIKKDFNL